MPLINNEIVHIDCRHFKGDLPCSPHKTTGVKCGNCTEYSPVEKRILIIKLGAIGDVIRTTPLLRRLQSEFKNAKIHWLTKSPEVLPSYAVDKILPYSLESLTYLQHASFDMLINLDKDPDACSLARGVHSTEKFGFTLKHGVVFPFNEEAHHKYLTGLFDDVSKANTLSYPQEIFNIMGWEFQGEEYVFDNHDSLGISWELPSGKRIGLNTGCGDRWTTRLWPNEHWIELIEQLKSRGYVPILLGGPQEDMKNKFLAEKTGAFYPGYFQLPVFINLMDQMDLIVTQVTMAMHIGIALRKKMVLMNNIFNPNEFDLYGRGEIVSPPNPCICYFSGTCKNGTSCMAELSPIQVQESVQKQFA
jgi:ADP-heptose:LPS heptosyltransferase